MQARWLLSILAVLFLGTPAWAQQELRSGTKGSSAAAPVTSTSIDANHQALDVNIAAGGSGNASVGTVGSAAPTSATEICGTDGTNCAVPKVLTTSPAANDQGLVTRNINPNLAADNSTNSANKVPILPCRANAAAQSWTEGNQVPCEVDLNGNGKVVGGIVARAAGSWTSATTVNTAVSVAITGYNTLAVFLTQGSTITGGVVTFEASDDNTNWYSVNACRMDTSVCGTTYTLQQSTNAPFEIDIGGATNFRARLSTVISGTGTVGVGVNPQAMPSEPSTTVYQGTSPWVNNVTQLSGVAAAAISADTQSAPTAFSLYNFNMCFNGTTWDRCRASGAVDAANNSAPPTNVEVIGATAYANGSQPTAITNGNAGRVGMNTNGALYAQPGGPVLFACSATGIAATLTQLTGCGAPGAGLSYYISWMIVQSNTSTAGNFLVRYGTGANCGTGTTSIYPAAATTAVGFLPANTALPLTLTFPIPIKVPANNLICVLGVATNTTLIDAGGFIAP